MEDELVEAAMAAARQRDQSVAEIPLVAVARAAGISRSTLLRRIGSRAKLDEAVRRAGVDPGSRLSVRERAVTATVELIAAKGLGAFTLDGVAEAARCAVPSLYAAFGSRDGLLAAVFDRYGPVPDLQQLAADPPDQLEETVRRIYRTLIGVFTRNPRVLPALISDLLARPDGPASRLARTALPTLVTPIDALLSPHVRAQRLRVLPLPLLVQLLIGPLLAHLLTRSALEAAFPADLPGLDEVCDTFAEAFLRAVIP